MPSDTQPPRADPTGFPAAFAGAGFQAGEADDGVFGGIGWWVTGGAALLAWTALSLLLTSA